MHTSIKTLQVFLFTWFLLHVVNAENIMPSAQTWSVHSGKATVSSEADGDVFRVTLPDDGEDNASWIRSPEIKVYGNTPYKLTVRMKSESASSSSDIWAGARVYELGSGWNPPDGSKYLFEVRSGRKNWEDQREHSGAFLTREGTKNLYIGILVRGKGRGEIIEIQPVSLEETEALDEQSASIIKLNPGEGTILLVGDDADVEKTVRKYFSNTSGFPGGALSRMLFGVYIPDQYAMQRRLNQHHVTTDAKVWYGQLLELLRNSGMNTIYIQGGGDPTKPEQMKSFAALCAKYGIQIIIQPGGLYFGESVYKAWTERRHAAEKEDVSYKTFFEDFIEPQLNKYLPEYQEETNIFAWAPVEELPPDREGVYVPYKKKIRELLPAHRIYQLDSQQNTKELLSSKLEPIPDVFAFDRYVWWHQDREINGKPVKSLWTPHFATRWLYHEIKRYADAVDDLYGKPAIAVFQGGARLQFFDAGYTNRRGINYPEHYGWEARADFFCPHAPDLKYHENLKLWSMWEMYLPPENAYSLMNWLGVCAGFKGVMLWNSLQGSPEALQDRVSRGDVKSGNILSRAILDYNLNVTPQWQEFSDSIREIKRYEHLILALKRSNKEFAQTEDNHVFMNSFVDADGRRFLVVVNGLIGEWGNGRSPDWTTKNAGLSVGEDGTLTGYTPLSEAREITLSIKDGGNIHDLRKLLPRDGHNAKSTL